MLVRSLGQDDPLEEAMTTLSSIPAWRIPVDRGAWRATVHGVTKSQARLKPLIMHQIPTACMYLQREDTVWPADLKGIRR